MKNVVFDIGGVLADYRLMEFLAAKGFDGLMIKRILKASIMSPFWESFERGELTEDEALDSFASLDPEIKEELRVAYEDISGMLVPQAYAIPWVRSLKERGFGVYYLSNYSEKAFRECSDSLAVLDEMDDGCLSFQEHLTKPDPAFFQLFLNRFGLAAEDCYFVDDTAVNVEVANSLGFSGIIFDSQESVDSQLLI